MGEVPEKEVINIKQGIEEERQVTEEVPASDFIFFLYLKYIMGNSGIYGIRRFERAKKFAPFKPVNREKPKVSKTESKIEKKMKDIVIKREEIRNYKHTKK